MAIIHSFSQEPSNDQQFLTNRSNDKFNILRKIMNIRIFQFISCFYQYNNFIKYQIMIFLKLFYF